MKNEIEYKSKSLYSFILDYKNNIDSIQYYILQDSLSNKDLFLNDSTFFSVFMASSSIFDNDKLSNQFIDYISKDSKYYIISNYFLNKNTGIWLDQTENFIYDNNNFTKIDSLEKYLSIYDSIYYAYFDYYKNEDSILYVNELNQKNNLLVLFQDTVLHDDLIDTLQIKDSDYEDKIPNINNDIVPGFIKK